MSVPNHIWHPFTQMARFDSEPPLVIESAYRNTLVAADGREYIDGVSSLWSIIHGHSHPHIVEAIQRQAADLQHSTLLGIGHNKAIEFSDRLVKHLPEGLVWTYFSSDGASAVEVSLKMAVQYWANQGRPERHRIVSLDMAYHGDTIGTASIGGEGRFRDPYQSLLFEPLRVPNPYHYRCQLCASAAKCTLSCLSPLATLLEERGDEIAAVIVEPRVQGAAGMIVAPEGHLATVRRLCDTHGILLIADEVATGFGRTGEMFACQLEGVTPDIMTLGKGITGGYLPLSATVTTKAVYDCFYDLSDHGKTLFHGHTYAGNPICCAAGIASLEVFENTSVLESARSRARDLDKLLRDRFSEHPHVGEIRQQGLMVGLELVRDRATQVPFAPDIMVAAKACLAARDRGVFLRPLGDIIVIMPPLSIEEHELSQIVAAAEYGLNYATRTT